MWAIFFFVYIISDQKCGLDLPDRDPHEHIKKCLTSISKDDRSYICSMFFILNLLIQMLQFEIWGFEFIVGVLKIWNFKKFELDAKSERKGICCRCHLHLKPGSTMVNSRTTFTCFGLFRRVGKPEKPNRRRHAGHQLAPYWELLSWPRNQTMLRSRGQSPVSLLLLVYI